MKDQIMTAAISLFARYGYKKTTIDDIAHELRIAKANIYRYFVNKEDLYHQAVSSVLDAWRAFVEEKIGCVSGPVEKFRCMSEIAIHYPVSNPDFCNILLQDPDIFSLSDNRDSYRSVNRPAEQLLRSVLSAGVSEGVFRDVNIEYTTELLFSIYMMHLIKIYGQGEGERGIEMYLFCTDLILRGLLK
jgi:AcrR family transcriptional regulator